MPVVSVSTITEELNFEPTSVNGSVEKETMQKIVSNNLGMVFLTHLSKNSEGRYKLMKLISKLFPVPKGSINFSSSSVYPKVGYLMKKNYLKGQLKQDGKKKKMVYETILEGKYYVAASFDALHKIMKFGESDLTPFLRAHWRVLQSCLDEQFFDHELLSLVNQDIQKKFEQEKLMKRYVTDNIDFLILASISKGKTYGYKIMKNIYKTFYVIPSNATIYESLEDLEKRGLLKFEGLENIESEVKRRKVYSITKEGEKYRKIYFKGLIRLANYLAKSYIEFKIEKMLEKAGIDINRLNELKINPLTLSRFY